jgi:hypothetical protein
VLFNVLCLLDDSQPGIEQQQAGIAENVEWRLFEYDGAGEKVGRPIGELHGDFHDHDPSGRRGEPRKRKVARKRSA